MKIKIEPDPRNSATHRLVTIEERGRVYAARWAEPWPDEARVLAVWTFDRTRHRQYRTFMPYNRSTDSFTMRWR